MLIFILENSKINRVWQRQRQLTDLLSRRNDGKVMISPKSVGNLLVPVPEASINIVMPVFCSVSELTQLIIEKQKQKAVQSELRAAYKHLKPFVEDDNVFKLGNKLLIPKSIIPVILQRIHRHIGFRIQYELIRNCLVYWN